MIRSAIPSDAKAIAQVHIRSWQQAYRDLMPSEYLASLDKTLPQRVSYWTNTIQSGDSTLLVAELDKQVIGWISVGASRDPDAAANNAGGSHGPLRSGRTLANRHRPGLMACWITEPKRTGP